MARNPLLTKRCKPVTREFFCILTTIDANCDNHLLIKQFNTNFVLKQNIKLTLNCTRGTLTGFVLEEDKYGSLTVLKYETWTVQSLIREAYFFFFFTKSNRSLFTGQTARMN